MDEPVHVTFDIDQDGLKDIQHLQGLLNSPNLGTALYNAVSILNKLYGLQNQGYELRIVKNGDVRRFRLPE